MKMWRYKGLRYHRAILFTAGALLLGTSAGAQTAQPAQPAPPAAKPAAAPQVQTTTYGDWVLRCTQSVAPNPPARSCEILQTVVAKGQNTPAAQIAFGKAPGLEGLHATVVVPLNVSFPSSVRIFVDDKDAQPVELPWTRCVTVGCFASTVPRDDVLKRWRGLSSAGKFTFKSAGGQEVAMPISFRGLAQALDALAKEK